MTFASGKLNPEWALANLERSIALARAPKLSHWVVEGLVDLAASLPAVATRILAAMLEHPGNEWDHIGWRDEADTPADSPQLVRRTSANVVERQRALSASPLVTGDLRLIRGNPNGPRNE
jgi:hypothetical protein